MEKKFIYQVVQKNFSALWENKGFFSNEKAAEESLDKIRLENERQISEITKQAEDMMVDCNKRLEEKIEKCPNKEKRLEPEDPWGTGACEMCNTFHTLLNDPTGFMSRSDRTTLHKLKGKELRINKFELYDKCI